MADPVFSLSGMQQSTDWNVDPKTQTVAGQLNSVIASDSPIMQQARARAMQTMNTRGLANSSMAVGAADSAVYDKALQIATPDAATYSDAAKTNAGMKNTFNLQNNSITGQTNAQNWGAQQDFGRQTARDATQQGFTQANMNLNQTNDLQKMQTQQGFTQANMNLNQTNDLQKMQTQQGFTQANMNLNQTNDLQKMQTQQGFTQANMNLNQTNDLAKMGAQQGYNMQTLTAQQQNELARMNTQQGFNMQTLTAQQANDLQKMQLSQQNNLQTLGTQYGFDIAKMDKQASTTLSQMAVEQQNALAKLAANQGYTLEQLAKQSGYDIEKMKVQAAAAMDVADIEATYKNITQGSQSATQVLNKMQDSLNALMAKDGLSAENRDAMAADIKANAAEALNLVGALATDLDLSSYIESIGL